MTCTVPRKSAAGLPLTSTAVTVTIDAPVAGSLTVGDQYMVELVAELMATAFEVANGDDFVAPLPGTARSA